MYLLPVAWSAASCRSRDLSFASARLRRNSTSVDPDPTLSPPSDNSSSPVGVLPPPPPPPPPRRRCDLRRRPFSLSVSPNVIRDENDAPVPGLPGPVSIALPGEMGTPPIPANGRPRCTPPPFSAEEYTDGRREGALPSLTLPLRSCP